MWTAEGQSFITNPCRVCLCLTKKVSLDFHAPRRFRVPARSTVSQYLLRASTECRTQKIASVHRQHPNIPIISLKMPSAEVEYSPITSEDETLGFLQACPRCAHAIPTSLSRPRAHRGLSTVLTIAPWITTVLFASLSFYFWARGVSQLRYGSYETGFQTDIIPPSEIPLSLVRFTGSPRFHENVTG